VDGRRYSLAFAVCSSRWQSRRQVRAQIGTPDRVLVFGVGSAISAIVGSSEQLIASRGGHGVGAALIMRHAVDHHKRVPADERRSDRHLDATAGVGVALGPSPRVPARALLLGLDLPVNLPIVAVGLLAGLFLIPTPATAGTATRLGRAISPSRAVGAAVSVIEAPSHGWTDGTSSRLRDRRRRAHRLLRMGGAHGAADARPALLANPRFSAASGAIAVTFFALFARCSSDAVLQFVLG